jgi:hypothetical protein
VKAGWGWQLNWPMSSVPKEIFDYCVGIAGDLTVTAGDMNFISD